MKGICHIWSRGRLISSSMPVGDDWCLNLSSQKRHPGRNLGEHRLVRRSGATSRDTVVLIFCLRIRSFPRTDVPTIFMGRSRFCKLQSRKITVVKFTYPMDQGGHFRLSPIMALATYEKSPSIPTQKTVRLFTIFDYLEIP